jgi:hypothetical protein
MGRPFLRLAFVSLLLGGCSNVGRFDVPKDPQGVPSVKTIVDQVNCELARLTDPTFDRDLAYQIEADGLVASVQLDLTVNNDGTLAPNTTFFNSMGTFSFNVGAKLDVQREQSFSETLFFDLTDYPKARKYDAKYRAFFNDNINALACPAVQDTPLAGDLGIYETVKMDYNSSANLNLNQKLTGAKSGSNAFSGYVKFLIVKNLNMVGPTWTLKHFKGPGSLGGLSETNTDQVTFGFAKRSASGNLPGAARAVSEAALSAQKNTQINTTLSQIQSGIR